MEKYVIYKKILYLLYIIYNLWQSFENNFTKSSGLDFLWNFLQRNFYNSQIQPSKLAFWAAGWEIAISFKHFTDFRAIYYDLKILRSYDF